MKPADFLRSLAQNDYMIDTAMLDDGKTLEQLADVFDTAADFLDVIQAARDRADAIRESLGGARPNPLHIIVESADLEPRFTRLYAQLARAMEDRA